MLHSITLDLREGVDDERVRDGPVYPGRPKLGEERVQALLSGFLFAGHLFALPFSGEH